MRTTLLFKNTILIGFLLTATILFSQKKRTETFSVSGDAVVTVNTSHTNVIFETWNKNKVEVEAYVDGENLSEEQKKKILDEWDLEVLGNSNKVVVTSKGSAMQWQHAGDMENVFVFNMDFLGPLMDEMPLVLDFNMPELPKDLLKDMSAFEFDYEEFKKDEEGYMKKFEKQIDKKLGKDFEKKMEAWGENFAKEWNDKNGDKISAEWEAKMEAWGKEFEAKMEEWEKTHGKDIEKWAEEMERRYNEDGNFQKQVITSPNGTKTIILKGDKDGMTPPVKVKANKTIIIRMPKDTKTEINVRHGELKMADAMNVRANLNYSQFTANSIDGGKTLINAAYAPVVVNNWNAGTLVVRYIDDCRLNNVKTIDLQSNSSNVNINYLGDRALLQGSFGKLLINKVSDSFSAIRIELDNTDTVINIPDVAFNFKFNGLKSTLLYPKSLQLVKTKKDNHVLLNGFNSSRNANRTVTIDATYSNVKMQ